MRLRGERNGSPAAVIVDVSSGKRSTLDLPELRGRVFGLRRYVPTHASPDGSLLAVQADDGKVLGWTLPNGGPARELATLGDNEVFAPRSGAQRIERSSEAEISLRHSFSSVEAERGCQPVVKLRLHCRRCIPAGCVAPPSNTGPQPTPTAETKSLRPAV